MKWLMLLLLVSCGPREPMKEFCETRCVDEREREVQVCSGGAEDAIVGAAVGYFAGVLLGAKGLGTAAGAAIGGSSDTRCYKVMEMHCFKRIKECAPNPEWEKWNVEMSKLPK